MKSLIITAHPSAKGFTHKIAAAYTKGAEKKGRQVELLDLYKTELKQSFFKFEDIRNITPDPVREKVQAKIKNADELIFIFPIWWMSMPAIMKNFFDTNFSAGFAFRYKKVPVLRGYPSGLLKGKTARVFVTCDGSRWFYKLMFTPFKLHFKYFILLIFGIKTKSFTTFDRMRWRSEKELEKYLTKVEKIAKMK